MGGVSGRSPARERGEPGSIPPHQTTRSAGVRPGAGEGSGPAGVYLQTAAPHTQERSRGSHGLGGAYLEPDSVRCTQVLDDFISQHETKVRDGSSTVL